jgi:response regulator of citrate/malate metabolism
MGFSRKLIREFNNKIIIRSTLTEEKIEKDAIAAGCFDYISKPINKNRITYINANILINS